MPEASLLQAEMDAKNGKTFEARQLLQILIGDLNAAIGCGLCTRLFEQKFHNRKGKENETSTCSWKLEDEQERCGGA